MKPQPPEPLPARLPVVHGYVRVSTKGQAIYGKSLEEQEAQINAFYHARGATNFGQWGGVFRDAASAFKKDFRKRKAGGELNERLQSGDHIIISDLSRAFRNIPDFVQQYESWKKRGITLHLLDYQISTDNKMGEIFLHVLAIFGQFQRDMISERTAAVQRYLRAAGKMADMDCEFGWKATGPKGKRQLVPDEASRETIRLIVKLRDEKKMPFRKIYLYLLERKIFTNSLPGGHFFHPDRKKGEWSEATIFRAYNYYKRNPEFKAIKRSMVMANGGKPCSAEFQKQYYAPLPAEPKAP